jgi:hypothetical protein
MVKFPPSTDRLRSGTPPKAYSSFMFHSYSRPGPGDEATRPARSRAFRVVWGIFLALMGSALGILVAFFSYTIFLLILFMCGLGGGTDAYIRNVTITAGTVAGGTFVVSIVCIILVMIRLHRRFG